MKTTLTLVLFLVFCGFVHAQCPSAGQDSSASYCKNEFFDVEELRSSDADTNGVFIDPFGDTMTNTVISLPFPGIYNFYYHVSDTSCPVDTAKYTITILSICWGSLTENTLENNKLIQSNPVSDKLFLNDPLFDQLEIYEISGSLILSSPTIQSAVIDISSLSKGSYLLVVDKNGIKQFQRFLKH